MRLLFFIAVIMAALVMSAPASAAPAEVVATKPSARALSLTRRMIAAMHVEDSMTPMLENLMHAQVAQIVADNARLSDQQKLQLTSALNEVVSEPCAA